MMIHLPLPACPYLIITKRNILALPKFLRNVCSAAPFRDHNYKLSNEFDRSKDDINKYFVGLLVKDSHLHQTKDIKKTKKWSWSLSPMLQQILRDMWVDPDLLAELGEDQKQILFCKMREEQIRRWKIWDERENIDNKPRQVTKVKFLLGSDGEPWTWVMGEHKNDRTIEQILEDEAREKARNLAEKETHELRKSVEAELSEILDMNQKQIVQLEAAKQLNRLKVSPLLSRRTPEIFSVDEKPKKGEGVNENELDVSPVRKKVSAAVAQWEHKVMEERTTVIFGLLRRKQLEAAKEAEDGSNNDEALWREQEKKAKEAENQIREIARRAREEHRRSSYCDAPTAPPDPLFTRTAAPSSPGSLTPDTPTNPATESTVRPPSKQAIVEWFREFELGRGAAVDENYLPKPWFHGLISRQESERILSQKPVGSYLIRLSERIWGYAISYRDTDRCKHYLIDASNAHYQFLGSDQMRHQTLGALVAYHEENAITAVGGELLRFPCQPDITPTVFSKSGQCSPSTSR